MALATAVVSMKPYIDKSWARWPTKVFYEGKYPYYIFIVGLKVQQWPSPKFYEASYIYTPYIHQYVRAQ